MTSQFGMTPEAMPLNDQRTFAVMLIAQHLIQKQHYIHKGPPLSPQQLATFLPGYQSSSPVRLITWWSENELLESGLHQDGNPADQFLIRTGPEPLFLEELINLAQGGQLECPPMPVESLLHEINGTAQDLG